MSLKYSEDKKALLVDKRYYAKEMFIAIVVEVRVTRGENERDTKWSLQSLWTRGAV